MKEIISLIIIGIALSMDTFSLSLSVGTMNISRRKTLVLAGIVGIFHFFMPFLGMVLGSKLIDLFQLQCDIVFGLILLFIAIQMIIDVFKKEEEKFQLNFLGIIIFALGVSLDSFSLGLGLNAITDNIVLAMSIFALCSALFTYAGVVIGKFASKIIGNYANIIGALILAILGISHLI